MISHFFLGLSLIGAQWVLYLLILLSIISVTLVIERLWFFGKASQGSQKYREKIRSAATHGNWEDVKKVTQEKVSRNPDFDGDLEGNLVQALIDSSSQKKSSLESLTELSQDVIIRGKLSWERNLSVLATIGTNAPFIGLFGTVLGIIKAFHDLSQQSATGAQTVTAGISESLVATAIGLLVAIPAVIAFNLFQRRVKSALAETEALKCFLIGKLID